MATIFNTDERYYGHHFESMAQQWRQFDAALAAIGSAVVKTFRDQESKRYLRTMPDYMLDDIGIGWHQAQ